MIGGGDKLKCVVKIEIKKHPFLKSGLMFSVISPTGVTRSNCTESGLMFFITTEAPLPMLKNT